MIMLWQEVCWEIYRERICVTERCALKLKSSHTYKKQQGTVVIRHSALLLLCLFELGAAGDGQRVREGKDERIPFLNRDEH